MAGEGDLVALRLARGCRAFVVRRDGELAGYGWLSAGAEWIGELGLEIRPRPGEAYLWNCVTLPPHRRRGCFRALLQQVAGAAGREGLSRLWIGSLHDGLEEALAGMGLRPVLRFRVRDLAGLRWLAVRPAAVADPALVAAALASLGGGAGRVRSGPRRLRRRRH